MDRISLIVRFCIGWLLCGWASLGAMQSSPRELELNERTLRHCLEHISAIPSLDASKISGFHFYERSAVEEAVVQTRSGKRLNIDRLRIGPDRFWVYKVTTNSYGDYTAYVIKDGVVCGPRTFFGCDSLEQLKTRIMTGSYEHSEKAANATRYFNGDNIGHSTIVLVQRFGEAELKTAYPPLESLGTSALALQDARELAEAQVERLSKPEIWRLLIDNDFDRFRLQLENSALDIEDQQNLLDIAISRGRPQCAEALVAHNHILAPSALRQAIKRVDVPTARIFLRFLDDKNAPLGLGKPSALIAACGLSQTMATKHDLIETILDAGADVDARDAQGRTPLMCAQCIGDEATVNQLMQWGATPVSEEPVNAGKKVKKSPKHKVQASPVKSALIILNETLAQAPERAIPQANELFEKNVLSRAEIERDSKELKNQRLSALQSLLIGTHDSAMYETCGMLCKSLIVKNLVTQIELMNFLTAQDSSIDKRLVAAILNAVSFCHDSRVHWQVAERLLRVYKDPALLKIFIKKCELEQTSFAGRTLLRSAVDHGNDAEIVALAIALDLAISDSDLVYAIDKNKTIAVLQAVHILHPDWSPFECIVYLGKAFITHLPDEMLNTVPQSEKVRLLVKAVRTNDQRLFETLCDIRINASTALDEDGADALTRVIQFEGEACGDNPLLMRLARGNKRLIVRNHRIVLYDLCAGKAGLQNIFNIVCYTIHSSICELLLRRELLQADLDRLLWLISLPGFDAHLPCRSGMTPLVLAIVGGNPVLFDAVVARCGVLSRAVGSATPLCYAFASHNVYACAKLLEWGAQWEEVGLCLRSGAKRSDSKPFFEILEKTSADFFDNSALLSHPDTYNVMHNEKGAYNVIRNMLFWYAASRGNNQLAKLAVNARGALSIFQSVFNDVLNWALERDDDELFQMLFDDRIWCLSNPNGESGLVMQERKREEYIGKLILDLKNETSQRILLRELRNRKWLFERDRRTLNYLFGMVSRLGMPPKYAHDALREIVDLLFSYGATSRSPFIDLIFMVDKVLPDRVEALLAQYPALKGRLTERAKECSPPGDVCLTVDEASILELAFDRYHGLARSDLNEQATRIALMLFNCCRNPMQRVSSANKDGVPVYVIDLPCRVFQQDIPENALAVLLSELEVNASNDGIFLIERCFWHIFKNHGNSNNIVAIINWICTHQDQPNKRLSDEHLVAACKQFDALVRRPAEALMGGVGDIRADVRYAAILLNFITAVEQHPNIAQVPEVVWVTRDFKDLLVKKQPRHRAKHK